MSSSAKDFGHIESDYEFFMRQSNEAEADVRDYLQEVKELCARSDRLSMLDFGCGTGDFTTRFLSALERPRELLEVSLLDPVTEQMERAAAACETYTASSVRQFLSIDSLPRGFDLILANHVLYYVDEIESTLRRFHEITTSDGMQLIAIAGYDNVLLDLWSQGFASIGEEVPYHSAEEVQQYLVKSGVDHSVTPSHYELRFPDSTANRLKIIRFLFGEHLQRIAANDQLSFFDQFVSGDEVVIETFSHHFTVRS